MNRFFCTPLLIIIIILPHLIISVSDRYGVIRLIAPSLVTAQCIPRMNPPLWGRQTGPAGPRSGSWPTGPPRGRTRPCRRPCREAGRGAARPRGCSAPPGCLPWLKCKPGRFDTNTVTCLLHGYFHQKAFPTII